jgi:hypothetical protein
MVALPYAMSYKKDRVALFKSEVLERTKDLLTFYGHREQDKRKIMTTKPIIYR